MPAIISVFILSHFLIFTGYVYAEDHSKSVPLILQSAENFFIFLDERNFRAAWELMTEKSHQTIINDIYEISADRGADISKDDISKNITSNGIIFNNYWQAFMTNFDPDVILKDRVWEFEKIESDYAVILLKKRNVTKLKIYKENNQWKVGLVESFWTRRHLKNIYRIQSFFSE
ncbi:MAG: hypothetical protein HY757_10380 [Nitrospirae bacterium]|nr:hypothetical protein [Nitrospirota bacterium]